jgi:hypothetical protein
LAPEFSTLWQTVAIILPLLAVIIAASNRVRGNKIANELNKRNIKSKRNSKWTANTILGMLQNERYIGDALYQKTYMDSNYKRHTNYGERDMYYIRDNHSPIISREDFEATALVLEQRAKEKNITKEDSKYLNRYAFSGKINCKHCGANFRRRTHTSGRHPIAWCCFTHISNIKACPMKYIPDSSFKHAFITMFNKLVFGYEKILIPLIIDMGIKIILQLAVGLIKAIPQLVAAIPQIITAIITGIGKAAISIVQVGKNIVTGLWNGISSMVSWIKDKISGFVGGIVSGVKGVLGIKSPSTVFAGIGDNMAIGLGEGFDKAMNKVSDDIEGAIPRDFDVDSNVNVNGTGGLAPSMNTGPLVTVQQMIVRSEDDIRKVSQELYNLMQTGSRAQGRFITV